MQNHKSVKNNQFRFLFENENPNFQTQAFRSFVKRKLKADSSTRGYFINGQTHKKAGRHQGDLRSLQLLSSEPLHNQNEKQAKQAKLLGISPKTLTLMKST